MKTPIHPLRTRWSRASQNPSWPLSLPLTRSRHKSIIFKIRTPYPEIQLKSASSPISKQEYSFKSITSIISLTLCGALVLLELILKILFSWEWWARHRRKASLVGSGRGEASFCRRCAKNLGWKTRGEYIAWVRWGDRLCLCWLFVGGWWVLCFWLLPPWYTKVVSAFKPFDFDRFQPPIWFAESKSLYEPLDHKNTIVRTWKSRKTMLGMQGLRPWNRTLTKDPTNRLKTRNRELNRVAHLLIKRTRKNGSRNKQIRKPEVFASSGKDLICSLFDALVSLKHLRDALYGLCLNLPSLFGDDSQYESFYRPSVRCFASECPVVAALNIFSFRNI